MAGKGGYQKPNNPATFSGPGKFSQRTDGGPGDMRQPQRDIPSAGYGEGVETAAIQASAPLSATGGAGGMQPQPIPFSAPTQRLDEDVTTGVDIGPGAGSSVLGMRSSPIKLSDTLATLLPYDPTGEIAIQYQAALSQGN